MLHEGFRQVLQEGTVFFRMGTILRTLLNVGGMYPFTQMPGKDEDVPIYARSSVIERMRFPAKLELYLTPERGLEENISRVE